MAAHVVVIDSTARSVKIKTTPGKHLTDILEESCAKLGRDAKLYGLKPRALDLSRTVMLSGLSPGAKLELVAASRSPSVVSVALQLPQVEPDGTARLTDKFPSNTTLWLILRKFESEGGLKRNLTARSTPLNEAQTSGSGRLYFETPVVTALNRELSTFYGLTKVTGSIGRERRKHTPTTQFQKTDTPLEDAMAGIEEYFKQFASSEVEPLSEGAGNAVTDSSSKSPASVIETNPPTSPGSHLDIDPTVQDQRPLKDINPVETRALGDGTSILTSEKPIETVTGPADRPIAVFAPPVSSTPKAVSHKENDEVFEPTLDHVKSHQRYLQANSRNKTLKSDAQLAVEAENKAQKIAQTKEVEIKLRFPDQSQVSASFRNLDTAHTLYEHAIGLMQNPNEPITLSFAGAKGRQTVPLSSEIKLISGLGLLGRVLVDVAWGDAASVEARSGPTLKEEYRVKAQELPVKVVEEVDMEQAKGPVAVEGKGKEREGKKGGMPKWFKGVGKR